MPVFGRAVHSLSKIGDELYIEPLEHGLSLRTVNSSRSAYACFVFAPNFFLHYNDSSAHVANSGDEEEAVKCKIGMKSCLTVFKSLSTLDKTVDKCKVTINMEEARLIFQMYCRHGIVKTHNLAFIECETLQAVFSKDMSPNVLTAQSRLLTDVVVNFQTNQEEISLSVNPEKVCIKNYTEDEPDPQKVIHTEMSLDPEEFEGYLVGVDTEITFCLKELRAILAFTESSNLPLSFHFESAGKPVVVCIDSDPTFEGNFVLATLADRSSQVSVSQQSVSQQSINMTTPAANRHSIHTPNISKRTNPRNSTSSTHRRATTDRTDGSYVESNGDNSTINNTTANTTYKRTKSASRAQLLQTLSEEMTDETTETTTTTTFENNLSSRQHSAVRNNQNKNRDTSNEKTLTNRTGLNSGHTSLENASTSKSSSLQKESESSPVIPLVQSNKKLQLERNISPMSEEDDSGGDEGVPGTPPAKKPRSMLGFFGISSQSSSQASQCKVNTTMNTSKHTVLAADTDSEDD